MGADGRESVLQGEQWPSKLKIHSVTSLSFNHEMAFDWERQLGNLAV